MVEEVPAELVRQERAQREAAIAEGIRQTTIDLRIADSVGVKAASEE